MTPALLLAGALAAVGWFVRARGATPAGAARHRRWMARAGAAFALPTLVALALLGRIDALWRMPTEFGPLRAGLPAMRLEEVAGGAFVGIAAGLAIAGWRARRGARPIGRPGSLTPRSRRELGWGAGVAVVAGMVEEPFFRMLLPLLVALATGSVLGGFVGATLLFAALHRYQGWRGVVAAGSFGALMAAAYLISGALWLVVAIHAAVDLGGLVVWPALARVSSSAASRCGRSA